MIYTIKDNDGNTLFSVEGTDSLTPGMSYESINSALDDINKENNKISKSIEAFNFISDTRAMEALGYITDGSEHSNSNDVEYTVRDEKRSKIREIFDKIVKKIQNILRAIKEIIDRIVGKIKDAINWVSTKIKMAQMAKISAFYTAAIKSAEVNRYMNDEITLDELKDSLKNKNFSKVFAAIKDIITGDKTKLFFVSYNIYTKDNATCAAAMNDLKTSGTNIDKYGKMILVDNRFPSTDFNPDEMVYTKYVRKIMDKMDKADADKLSVRSKFIMFMESAIEFSKPGSVSAYASKLTNYNSGLEWMRDRASAIIDYSEETKDKHDFTQEELHCINTYQGCVLAFCRAISYFSKFIVSLLVGTNSFISIASMYSNLL